MDWLNLPGCPPLWVVWFLQLVSNFCCLVAAFSRGFLVVLFLFYFNGEFDPGSG
jgi:hypothetical protein